MILLAFGISFTIFITDAFGWCPENNDWPDAPCYTLYQITSESFEDKVKEDWEKYYDYKGELWMEQKRYEMKQAIQTDFLYKWLDLAESHHNVHYYYYLQGEAPDVNGEYVFTCNMYEDLSQYEEILKDDIILKKFLEIFPSATSSIVGGIDESRPPQTSILYQFEKDETNVSLLMRVFEGEDEEPCLVPRLYTLTYNIDSEVREVRYSSFDTEEILEFLESLSFSQPSLKQFNSGTSIYKIECKDGLVQVFKKTDNSPACVTLQTKSKLIERGWADNFTEVVSNTLNQKQLIASSESYTYEDLCGFPVTDMMRLNTIYDNSHRFTQEGISYFELYPGNFTHTTLAENYIPDDPHLNYWFDLENGEQIYFRIGACDVDGSDITRFEKRN